MKILLSALLLFAVLSPADAPAQRRDSLNPVAPTVRPPAVTPTLTPTPTDRGQTATVACCLVTGIVGVNVTAEDSAHTTVLRFRVMDPVSLRGIAVGTPVWADFVGKRAGFEPGNLCCPILSSGPVTVAAVAQAPGRQPPTIAAGRDAHAPSPVVTGAPGRDAAPPVVANEVGRDAPPPVVTDAPGRDAPPPVVPNTPGRNAPTPVVPNAPRGGTIDADPGYRVLKRDPVPFRAFIADDLGPGASPDRQVALPNGRSLSVEMYLAEVNALEERLNGIGYSLRELGDSPETATVIEEPTLTAQQLMGQSGAIAATHLRQGAVAADRAVEATAARFQQSMTAALAGRPALVQAMAGRAGGAPRGVEKSWDLPIGDPESAWASLDGEFTLDGTAEGTTVEVTQRVRAAVLDHDLELLSLTGTLTSPIGEAGQASMGLEVLGNTIPIVNEPGDPETGLIKDGSITSPISWDFTDELSVGGVEMNVGFSAGGSSGVDYYIAMGGGSVVGVITPFITVEIGADIKSINMQVVEAGVAGELLIVEDRLTIAGSASLQYDNAAGKPYVYYDYLGVNNFEALQGNLNIYVCAYVVENWQPKKKCWRKYLWKEDGIDLEDTMFSGNEKVYFD